MGDIYYPPPLQSFAYSSGYPAQLSQPDHNNAQASAGSYLAALQSQLRETGQVNAELLRQHQMASSGAMLQHDGRMMMSGAQANGWGQQPGPTSFLQQQQQQQQQHLSGSNLGPPMSMSMRPQAQQRHQSTPPPSSPEEHSLSPQQEEEAAPVKAASKRGRKKKGKKDDSGDAEPFDDLDDEEGKGKRGRRPSLNANEKRKLQNRAAQRAFRERKEKHVRDLEEKVAAQDDQLHAFRDMITRLQAENEALRRGENVPLNSFHLPPPPDFPSRRSSHSQLSASEATHHSPPPRRLPSPPPPHHAVPAPTMQSYSFAPSPDPNLAEPTMTLSRTPVSMERGSDTPERYMYNSRSTTGFVPANYLAPTPTNPSGDLSFDFDAPFDFTTAVPLPPLFQDLLDTSFPSSLLPADETMDDCCPGDTDDAPALPGGRLPCDKPECDFSVISCALPMPWRPQAVESGVGEKETWVCKQAWGKLCSHPMFGQCDVDELCRELRDRTRCSDDGRLVILKADVCEVFKSIPARARALRDAQEMREGGR